MLTTRNPTLYIQAYEKKDPAWVEHDQYQSQVEEYKQEKEQVGG